MVGAKQAVGTVCDDGDMTTENDEIQTDGCNCMGTMVNIPTCQAPTNPTVSNSSGRRIMIDWTPVSGVLHYVIQIRFKGVDRWLVTSRVRSTKVNLYGPLRNYEYRIKSICEEGESEYSPIYEFSISTLGRLATAATARIKDVEATEILIEEEALLYPNPVGNQLNLFYPSKGKEATFLIYDNSGQIIYEQKLSISNEGNAYPIHLNSLGAGFYLGVVKEKGEIRFFEKFIKQ